MDRGTGIVGFVALLALGLAGIAPAPAAAAPLGGLHLLLPVVKRMLPGQQGWIQLRWLASTDVCDVQITAAAPGVAVGYPVNTGTYASLPGGAVLRRGQADFTALHLAIPASTRGSVRLTVRASYVVAVPGTGCRGQRVTSVVTAGVLTVRHVGPPFTQTTVGVSVRRSVPAWVRIGFHGYAPGLDDFRVILAPPADLAVAYPTGGSSTGLYSGGALAVGADDWVAVHLDASRLAPGRYVVPLRVRWSGGDAAGSVLVTVL